MEESAFELDWISQTQLNYITPWAQLAETAIRNNGTLKPLDWANAAGATLTTAFSANGGRETVIANARAMNFTDAFNTNQLVTNLAVGGALALFDDDAAKAYLASSVGHQVGQFIGQQFVEVSGLANAAKEAIDKLVDAKKVKPDQRVAQAAKAHADGTEEVYGAIPTSGDMDEKAISKLKGDEEFQTAKKALQEDEKYKALPKKVQDSINAQLKHYEGEKGDIRVVRNLHKLVHNYWFGKIRDEFYQRLAFNGIAVNDSIRTVKVIAALSAYDGGDREIIDNTLSYILESDDVEVRWEYMKDDNTLGLARKREEGFDRDVIALSRKVVSADNKKIDLNAGKDDKTRHLVLSTLAHEAAHIINRDIDLKDEFVQVNNAVKEYREKYKNRKLSNNLIQKRLDISYEILVREYRAWYIGYKAEHGSAPNTDDAATRVAHLLTGKIYLDSQFTDSEKIHKFLSEFSGQPISEVKSFKGGSIEFMRNRAIVYGGFGMQWQWGVNMGGIEYSNQFFDALTPKGNITNRWK
jgi:hypothetical protein